MSGGMLCVVLGLLVLTRITADSSYALLLAGYLLFGIALGLVYAPMSTAAMAAMPPQAGIASGVLAMDRVLAVALAATGALFHALLGDGHSFAVAIGRRHLGSGGPLRRRHRPHLALRPRRSPASGRRPAPLPLKLSCLTNAIPTCPLGLSQTAFQSAFCHSLGDAFVVRG
ncbi:MAG: hypothetical protein ACTHNP_07205 [Solirubrobacterales bacterium]